MGLFEDIKKAFTGQEDDFEDEYDAEETPEKEEPVEKPKKESSPRMFQSDRKKVVAYPTNNAAQMQVVLCKPERFDDSPAVADHLNENKTVVLNLESANREASRRIIDFLSGVVYANNGNIKKVAKSTYICTPDAVNVMGELMLDDFDGSDMYV